MISRIKEKETEILQQKIYAEGIISSMIEPLIVVNPDSTLKSVNKATCDLLGYTKEELIGKDARLIFIKEKRLFKGNHLRKFIEEGSARDFAMTYKTKSGEKIPVSFSGSVMRDENGKLIGVVGIAHDMRQIKTLMADLEGTKAVVEEYARDLEKKVEERTKDLAESRQATLNIMKDIQESKEELEKKTIELEKAKAELESFSKGFEEKVKERTAELSTLYEVASAISYTLDYQTLLKLIMESLFKIVDYDICGSLLFDANTANITLKLAYPDSAGLVDEIKHRLIDSTSALSGETIRKKRVNAFLIPSDPNAQPKEKRQFVKLCSYFNVPFVVRGKTRGMINVSSCRDNAFSEDDIKLIYTIVNQASNAIERLQAVITAEKSKMESMVESMAEGVSMIDERGEIVVLNPQGRHMLGFNLTEEVTSKHLTEKMKVIGLYDAFQACQNEQRLITKEITVLQGGKSVVLRCDIAPVKEPEGDIIGMVTILRDITREKEIDKMKTEFISTVSHELRTPLTTMKEFTSIISDEIPGKLNKEQREYLDIIRGNIDRLARLINNLLDISKIEAGRVELKNTLVDITDIAKATVSTLKPEADGKYIEVKTLFPAIAMDVYVDPDKITQVFTNLISNAIKFTPEKGKITVEIKDAEKEIECSVTDTGKGIGADDMGKLFGKFQQFGRVAGAGAKGTGLGLAISKELVEMHNGRIWAESKIGKRSKFIFTLPKYTTESLFEEYVNNGIKEAVKSDSKMSIIMVSVLEFEKLKQELSIEKLRSILKDMEGVLAKGLRRQDDVAFKDDDEIVVILASCDKEGALRAEGRSEQVLGDYLTRQKLDKKIELRVGCATYPDEAKEAKGLIAKARKS